MVAGLADALLPMAVATVVGNIGQSDATADLTAVLEVAIEHLVGQDLRNLRTDRPELGKLNSLGLDRPFLRRLMGSRILRLEYLDLLLHQQQPLMLPADLAF